MARRTLKRVLAFALCILSCCGLPAVAAPLTFGIVPQQSAERLAQAWEPVMAYLQNRTGVELKFVTAPSIPSFEERCAAGEYDLAYMNPYHYTVFSRAPGYRAFANQANKKIEGILVVRKDSPVVRLEDLAGAELAFPAPAAFAASMLTRAHLETQKIPFRANYVYSHDATYKAVARGDFVAGGGILRTFNALDDDTRSKLRLLWTTNKFTPHAFAARPSLDPQQVAAIQAAMVEMAESDEGRARLKPLGFSAIQAANDSDWDDVRGLNISLLDRLVKE